GQDQAGSGRTRPQDLAAPAPAAGHPSPSRKAPVGGRSGRHEVGWMIVVDSSVWIDYFRGVATPQSDRLDPLLGAEPLAIGDLMLAEVLQGFDDDRDFDLGLRLLRSVTLIDIAGQDVAIQAARNFRTLRG